MQFDKRMLDRILKMNDRELEDLIKKIALEAGLDPSVLSLNHAGLSGLRSALGSATDEDLQRLNTVYGNYKKDKPRG